MSKEIKENFDFAVNQIRNSKQTKSGSPTNEQKLKFYGLYKQATLGKCNTPKPWAIQVEAYAKWNAWNDLGNMKKEV